MTNKSHTETLRSKLAKLLGEHDLIDVLSLCNELTGGASNGVIISALAKLVREGDLKGTLVLERGPNAPKESEPGTRGLGIMANI